jgi:hypothetical protein
MSTMLSGKNRLPKIVDPSIQSTLDRYQQQINSAIKQLESFDYDIDHHRESIRLIRDQLLLEIEGLDERSEVVQIICERVKIADAFLNAPNGHIEIAIAREYLDSLKS